MSRGAEARATAGVSAAGVSPEWTHPEFARIAAYLHREAGLVFPANRRSTVESGMRRAMARAGLRDPGALRTAVEGGAAVLDDVIAELTIGETYFFREPRQLDVIRRVVLPELAQRSGPPRPIRMWSAGCASGEEPYSLAILLREAGWRGPAHILGTDLAAARLAAARRGRYTRWSFRGVPGEIVHRYFEAERKHFVLDPSIRELVEFRVLNLADDLYPSAASGAFGMDAILCRNVLIYFDAATVARVAARLLTSLAEGGWLFLSASDPMLAGVVPCEVVMTEAGIAYRRATEASTRSSRAPLPTSPPAPLSTPLPAPESAGPPARPAPVPPAALLPTARRTPAADASIVSWESRVAGAYAAADYERAASLAAAAAADGDHGEMLSVLWVRALADQGRLVEAGAVCAGALDRHRMSAELTYLHATLLAQSGRWGDAAAGARRALYLDRGLAVGHLLLGEALARTGNPSGAALAFQNAEVLLAPLAPDTPVLAAGGEPSARLLALARARRSALAGAR